MKMYKQSTPTFFNIGMVNASHIKSQWQAHFLQIFPLRLDELPKTHESDKKCFEDNWRGGITSYEDFMGQYYKGWLL